MIESLFGGESRKFDINPIGAWRAVEARCGVGLGRVLARLSSCMAADANGRMDLRRLEIGGDDIREVLFQGLRGAGMPDLKASQLMTHVYDALPGKLQYAPLAVEIVSDWMFGLPEGKTTAPETESETATAAAVSTSARSTEQPLQ